MKLSEYDKKYVRITDKWGESFTGTASYGSREFLEEEYGGNEDGIFIEDVLIYESQIDSIEITEMHGTAELLTDRLVLRRYRHEDADQLYRYFGSDPEMCRYSGWNPYPTLETAQDTVDRIIAGYDDEHSYSWIMDTDDVIVGTIGAYDFTGSQIEVGFSVREAWRGRGYATEALKKVLEYLTENEGIDKVTAWCASENTGSRTVLEKSGMRFVGTEKCGLTVGENVYDKLIYEYNGIERRIERISMYESKMEEAGELIKAGCINERLAVLMDELEAYYTGPLWKQDYACDEAHRLPENLKRGVLSEDGLFNMLEEYRGLARGK